MARRINQIREIHSISNDTLENRRKVFERRAAPYKLLADTAIFRREAFDTSFSPFAASSPASIFPLISFVFQRKKKFSPFYSPHRLQEVIDRGFDDPTPREPLRDARSLSLADSSAVAARKINFQLFLCIDIHCPPEIERSSPRLICETSLRNNCFSKDGSLIFFSQIELLNGEMDYWKFTSNVVLKEIILIEEYLS